MKFKSSIILSLFMLIGTLIFSQSQDNINLTPTNLEAAQLGKLKAQSESLQNQIATIDTQIKALQILKQLTEEHYQQKNSEYLGLANTVKTSHKEWGDSSKVSFNPTSGDSGLFTKQKEQIINNPVKK